MVTHCHLLLSHIKSHFTSTHNVDRMWLLMFQSVEHWHSLKLNYKSIRSNNLLACFFFGGVAKNGHHMHHMHDGQISCMALNVALEATV